MRRLTEQHGKILAKQFVQRTRGDVLSAWPGEVRFPKRDPLEAIYSLTGEHHKLFADVLAFTRETVQDPSSANRAVRYAITAPGMYGSLVGFAELAISFSLMFTVLVVTNHEKIAPYTALVVGAMIATSLLSKLAEDSVRQSQRYSGWLALGGLRGGQVSRSKCRGRFDAV